MIESGYGRCWSLAAEACFEPCLVGSEAFVCFQLSRDLGHARRLRRHLSSMVLEKNFKACQSEDIFEAMLTRPRCPRKHLGIAVFKPNFYYARER